MIRIKQTLNDKVFCWIYQEKGELYVEALFLLTHKHLKTRCESMKQALKIYNYTCDYETK